MVAAAQLCQPRVVFFLQSGLWFGAGGEDQSVPSRSRRSHRATPSVRVYLEINPQIQLQSHIFDRQQIGSGGPANAI
jgi:hypothetical protein